MKTRAEALLRVWTKRKKNMEGGGEGSRKMKVKIENEEEELFILFMFDSLLNCFVLHWNVATFNMNDIDKNYNYLALMSLLLDDHIIAVFSVYGDKLWLTF